MYASDEWRPEGEIMGKIVKIEPCLRDALVFGDGQESIGGRVTCIGSTSARWGVEPRIASSFLVERMRRAR